jgi:hypothetical protein
MAEQKVTKVTEGEELSKVIWHYVGVAVLWLSLLLSGLAVERLGLTSNYLTSIIPSEVGQLKQKNAEYETNQRKVMDENQRLKGLIGREQATSDALTICQGEKKKIEDELKQAKAGAH